MQDLFLMIPSISRWQGHPFTIMSKRDNGNGRTNTITIAMKYFGRWTQVWHWLAEFSLHPLHTPLLSLFVAAFAFMPLRVRTGCQHLQVICQS
jgi:FAD-binding domain